jgi:hypothetical protein
MENGLPPCTREAPVTDPCFGGGRASRRGSWCDPGSSAGDWASQNCTQQPGSCGNERYPGPPAPHCCQRGPITATIMLLAATNKKMVDALTHQGGTPAATLGRSWAQAATSGRGWTQAGTQAATPAATPGGGMANIVYCDTNDLCQNNYYFALSTSSSCNPTNLPTSHTVIANSGASGIYFASNAPVANLNPTAPSIGVRVANDLPVRSVASATLASAPSLPPAAMQGHVMPSFPHTLISLGPFADLGCQIDFSKHAVSVIHTDGHSILDGWREQDGPLLWRFPLKATTPILPEFDPILPEFNKKCTGTIGTVFKKGATMENVLVCSLPLKATRPIILEFAKKRVLVQFVRRWLMVLSTVTRF